MSVEAMALVLNHSEADPTDRMVLVGIANHERPDGGGAWPSIAKLCRYSGKGPEAVRRSIRRLEKLGEVEVVPNGGGTRETPPSQRPNLYRVLVRCPDECDHSTNHRMPDEAPSPERGHEADPPSSATQPPLGDEVQPPSPTRAEPSLEPSSEPSKRPSPRKRRSSPEAKELTDEWWERLKAQGQRPRGSTAYVATRGIIQTILNEAVYPVDVVRQALERLGTRPPTAQRLRDQCWGVNREIEEARPPTPGWQTERYDETTDTMVQKRASEADEHEGRAGGDVAPPGSIRGGDRDSRHDVLGWEPGDGDRTRSPADRGSVDDRVERRVPAGAEPAAASEPGGGGGAPRGDADDPLRDRGGGDRPPE